MIDHRHTYDTEASGTAEGRPTSDTDAATLDELIDARYNRRAVLKGTLGVTVMGALTVNPLTLLAGL